jgi:hypothetical protein
MPVPQANSKTEPFFATCKRAQILGVGLEQHRAEVAIVRRGDGSGKLCVFVFHTDAVFAALPTYLLRQVSNISASCRIQALGFNDELAHFASIFKSVGSFRS